MAKNSFGPSADRCRNVLHCFIAGPGEDADQPHNKTTVHYDSNVAGCLSQQTSVSDTPEYVAGTFVWTLHALGWAHAKRYDDRRFGTVDLGWGNRRISQYQNKSGMHTAVKVLSRIVYSGWDSRENSFRKMGDGCHEARTGGKGSFMAKTMVSAHPI